MKTLHVFISLLFLLCTLSHAGLKRRVAEAEQCAEKDRAKVEPDSKPRGSGSSTGLKKRVFDQQATDHVDNRLAQDFKQDWAKGKLTSQQLQKYSASSASVGATGMDPFAALGNYGKHTGNIFRDLVSKMDWPIGAPRFSWIEIATKFGPATAHPVIMPHALFAQMHRERPHQFASHITGPKGSCLQFWESVVHTAYVAKHAFLKANEYFNTVPLGFHGDAGAYSDHDSVYVLSWNSLVGSGTTHQQS